MHDLIGLRQPLPEHVAVERIEHQPLRTAGRRRAWSTASRNGWIAAGAIGLVLLLAWWLGRRLVGLGSPV